MRRILIFFALLASRVVACADGLVIETTSVANPTNIIFSASDGNAVRTLAFSPDGRTLTSSGGAVKLWSLAGGSLPRALGTATSASLAFSPDGTILASVEANSVRLWNITNGASIRLIPQPTSHSVSFFSDCKTLAIGTLNGVQLWDLASSKFYSGLTTGGDPVAFSRDNTLMASASGAADNAVWLYDATRGVLLLTLAGHSSAVQSVAFSPDGAILATGSDDKTVRLWNLRNNGALLNVLQGAEDSVISINFLTDSKTLVGFSKDKKVRLWRVADGKLLHTLADYPQAPMTAAVSSDDRFFATGDAQGRIIVARNPLSPSTTGSFRFTVIKRVCDRVSIFWEGAIDARYQLEKATSLDGQWQKFGEPLVGTTAIDDITLGNAFYRVQKVPN